MKPVLDPQNSPTCLMSQLTHTLRQEFTTALADMNLTVLQIEILADLATDKSLSTADLARLTFVTPQNMSLAISRLAGRGYLVRRAHATNARINRLALTAKGKRVLYKAAARAKKVEAATFGILTPHERSILLGSLRKCLSRFENNPTHKAVHPVRRRATNNATRRAPKSRQSA
ncbi:MAG: MarR family winged helix-turn-helix transcriptional regulator [Candidatus Acidiferrales bacterium]